MFGGPILEVRTERTPNLRHSLLAMLASNVILYFTRFAPSSALASAAFAAHT